MSIIPGENVGPYRIVEQLGSGGMATVFKAFQPALDRYVAIKVLHPALMKDDQFFERFKREARIVGKLEHPHIIPIYDFSDHNREPYLVMRFVEGSTLKPRMDGVHLLPHQILALMRPVCQAVDYAHQQGVLHRDLKPSNIMVSQEGSVFVTDFGLARMMQAGESTLSQDMLVGTPQYISPEQAQGLSDLDGRTDVYALGVILFEMLTGQVPFNADTPFATIHDHIYSPLPIPSQINPDIAPGAERLLLKTLAKEPEDRFATAGELLTALEQTFREPVIAGRAATAVGKPTPTFLKTERPAIPWWVWGGGALAALILLVALVGSLWWIRANRPLADPATPPVATQVAATVPDGRNDDSDTSDASATDQQTDLPVGDSESQAAELTRQAWAARQQSQPVEAAALYQQAIATEPTYLPAYFGLSQLQQQQGDGAGSVATLETAVENNPERYEAQTRLGEAYFFNDQPEMALDSFDEAIALEPEAVIPYIGQALVLFSLDRDGEAKEQIDQALSLDPDSPQARLGQAIYLHRQGNQLQALRITRQLFQEGDNAVDFDRERARRIFTALTEGD